jgi:hypothetical protein
MEGSLESISEGNRTRGTMQMKSKDGQMSMKFDNTKLGAACEALDYSDYKPPVGKAAPAGDADLVCRNYAKEIEQDPAKAASYASLYAGAGATCGKSPAQKTFCTAAQSHRGFVTLDLQERRMVKAMAGSGSDGAGSVDFHPLTLSLGACGLGATPAATETLRQNGSSCWAKGTRMTSGPWWPSRSRSAPAVPSRAPRTRAIPACVVNTAHYS